MWAWIGCHHSLGFLVWSRSGLGTAPNPYSDLISFTLDQANCPGRSEALSTLTQLARWGYAPFPRNWVEVIERRPSSRSVW
jgi:nitrate/nitrite transport system ATP-binding protein